MFPHIPTVIPSQRQTNLANTEYLYHKHCGNTVPALPTHKLCGLLLGCINLSAYISGFKPAILFLQFNSGEQ